MKNFSVSYYGYGRKVAEAEFSLDEGEVLCLLGAEGSGKTTLLRGLAGLEESEGEVKIGGHRARTAMVEARLRKPTPRG